MSLSGHIDIAVLEEYLLEKLEEKERGMARKHLDRCALCSLELKRLERFLAIDADEDLSRDAEWLFARQKLERSLGERIIPAARHLRPRLAILPRMRLAARWLVPVAAAAGIIFLLARLAPDGKLEVPLPGAGFMGGAPPAVEYMIDLVEPAGEVDTPPAIFRWTTEGEYSQYLLEIFTPSLDRVYIARNIAEKSWSPPDSLMAAFEPNVIYLWSVRGYRGYERPAVSPNGWFRIGS